MTQAIEGYGSYMQRSPDGVSYTTVAEVTKITGPGLKVKTADASHLQSPANRNEFIGLMADEGEIKLELNFTRAEFFALRGTVFSQIPTSSQIPVPYYWKVVFSQGSSYTGAGWLTDLEPTLPYDDKISATCTIKCTGLWSFVQ